MRNVFALAALAALSACGNDTGPAQPSSVALLTNPAFVEYDTSTYVAEASELEFTIRGYGIPVTPVIAYDSASLMQTLANHPVFVVPEGEGNAVFPDSLTHGTFTALRNWVDSSGGLMIVVPDFPGAALVDSVFGYALSGGVSARSFELKSSGASGTPFQGGPARVWENDGVYLIDPAYLPPEASIIYQGVGGGIAVAVVPRGRGAIIFIGWDWYNAAPHGSQDGGWIDVLRRALRY